MNYDRIADPHLRQGAKNRDLLPTEADFKGKKGYSRRYRKDGSYSWRYRFKPNENGRLTKEAQEVGALMHGFNLAEMERQSAKAGAPGAYAGRGKWTERIVYHGDGTTTVLRRG